MRGAVVRGWLKRRRRRGATVEVAREAVARGRGAEGRGAEAVAVRVVRVRVVVVSVVVSVVVRLVLATEAVATVEAVRAVVVKVGGRRGQRRRQTSLCWKVNSSVAGSSGRSAGRVHCFAQAANCVLVRHAATSSSGGAGPSTSWPASSAISSSIASMSSSSQPGSSSSFTSAVFVFGRFGGAAAAGPPGRFWVDILVAHTPCTRKSLERAKRWDVNCKKPAIYRCGSE